MAARWSQRHISSLLEEKTNVISKLGGNVTLSCWADLQLESVRVSWYHLNQHGSHTVVFSYSSEDDHIDQSVEFQERTSLVIRPKVVMLHLRNVKLQDSGTYKCILQDNQQSVEQYVILQVTDPKETLQDDDDSVVIYTMVGFILAGLVAWMISFCILCKRGDLQCSRNWDQQI
ncbi:erythroid membrane-associated protein-like isoform X2 [Antechinus flavipes]|uniref:erythroid membrane-associated protein-like isoform X2 n=1 Tax=Antechinus flavipes TaxID=38775 RepID=UPI002235F28A|nr:erythroid membrane-associated protein-like isoform X2 [Antechinus flavipes]